jgi:hypothetical protein
MSSAVYDFRRQGVRTWPAPSIGTHIAFQHLFSLETNNDLWRGSREVIDRVWMGLVILLCCTRYSILTLCLDLNLSSLPHLRLMLISSLRIIHGRFRFWQRLFNLRFRLCSIRFYCNLRMIRSLHIGL